MDIREISLTSENVERLIALSVEWEAENITHGLRANDADTFTGMRVFAAFESERMIGYISTSAFTTDRPYSMVHAVGTPCWEIEELYVLPEFRSKGIGRALFEYAECAAKKAGAEFIFLSTATKDHRRILHFYIDELGMEFWNARLFKHL